LVISVAIRKSLNSDFLAKVDIPGSYEPSYKANPAQPERHLPNRYRNRYRNRAAGIGATMIKWAIEELLRGGY
jgi:hypothetical protein